MKFIKVLIAARHLVLSYKCRILSTASLPFSNPWRPKCLLPLSYVKIHLTHDYTIVFEFSSFPSSARSIQLPVLYINSTVLPSAVLNSLG